MSTLDKYRAALVYYYSRTLRRNGVWNEIQPGVYMGNPVQSIPVQDYQRSFQRRETKSGRTVKQGICVDMFSRRG